MTSYNTCKSNIVSKIITEFNENKLKLKNKNQALAIGLKMSENKCSYNKEDVIKLLNKVKQDLNNIEKKINLKNIKEKKVVMMILKKKKKIKQINIYKKLLIEKLILFKKNNEILSNNIWNELKIINNI